MEPTTNFAKLPDRAPTAKKVASGRREMIRFSRGYRTIILK
jgi:hypothetical protein